MQRRPDSGDSDSTGDCWAIEPSNSLIFDQAGNRLHAAKAVLVRLLGKG